MSRVELAGMTWREAAAARDRRAVVLIPIGTLEQNGSISPLAADTLVAVEVARRTAERTQAVVAPAINYGSSLAFRHFPGTVSLKPDTFRALIVDVCENLIRNGFDHLLLVNCHMTNEPVMDQAAREIRDRLGILLGFFNPITLAQSSSKDLYSGIEETLGHGAEPVASMIRSFAPDLVRIEQAQFDPGKDFQGLPVVAGPKVKVGGAIFGLYLNQEEAWEIGGLGDPTASDPERGAEIMRRVIDLASNYVRVFGQLRVTEQRERNGDS